MWIQVRAVDGKKSAYVSDLSMSLKIEDLRTKLAKEFNAPVSQQVLFYRGKQLEDGYTLFDYGINLNDVVQILIRPFCEKTAKNDNESNKITNYKSPDDKVIKLENEVTDLPLPKKPAEDTKQSFYFKVKEQVDVKDPNCGAWFEAEIKDIVIKEKSRHKENLSKICTKHIPETNIEHLADIHIAHENLQDDGFIYYIEFARPDAKEPSLAVEINSIRPRAKSVIQFEDITEGDVVMVNYNINEPEELGYWYDCKIASKRQTRNTKELTGTIYLGPNQTPLDDCKIAYTDEIFHIEKVTLVAQRDAMSQVPPGLGVTRPTKMKCFSCEDESSNECIYCKCQVCGHKDKPHKQIRCKECDVPFHIWCLDHPITDPTTKEKWYCPFCKNGDKVIVKPGVKLKNRIKEKEVSSLSHVWGKGMSCARRTKVCTAVPKNHFGPIPGIEVGMSWKFRVQVSEVGIHRPTIGGIHGRENEGAYSIILSGCYENDLDNGEEFQYTGSGSKDYSGKKCVPKQRCNQTLTKLNRALALNCAVRVNEKGAESQNWKKGKPVRVIRNYKGRKYSKFCPENGNRYDGIYKVVKYWKEKGKTGYFLWRFLLRRDDPAPAPWTVSGKKRVKEMGLEMQYPAGYAEAVSQKEAAKNVKHHSKKHHYKRPETVVSEKCSNTKRLKFNGYNLPSEIISLIEKDSANEKLWNKCKEHLIEGFKNFFEEVENSFRCVNCQKITMKPVTTECFHILCKPCIEALFEGEVCACPVCHHVLSEHASDLVNETLSQILLKLLPSYCN